MRSFLAIQSELLGTVCERELVSGDIIILHYIEDVPDRKKLFTPHFEELISLVVRTAPWPWQLGERTANGPREKYSVTQYSLRHAPNFEQK